MIQAIVTDIEGTTTSLSFVHEVLFPHAREHLPAFVREHAEEPEVHRWLQATAEQAGDPRMSLEHRVEVLQQWMAEERKITPLKMLQGLLWENGYARGAYTGHVYPDAAAWLKTWHEQGIRLYVYSSGSIKAQQLLFAHTAHGDLTPLFSGYFDTLTGPKQAVESYQAIARTIGLPPENILFLSDMLPELDAARAAGMRVIHLIRDSEPKDQPAHPQARDFNEVRALLENE